MTTIYTFGTERNFNQAGNATLWALGLFGRKSADPQTGDKKLYKCPHCDMTFAEKERMQRHERKAHRERGGDMPNRNPFGF